MPSPYIVRSFAENHIYHVFSRGLGKHPILKDEEDYKMFKYYLFIYLTPLEKVLSVYPQLPLRLHSKNLSEEIDLIAYCLMPNHFHLLIKQNTRDSISKLLKQISNAYTRYFNIKYKRSGSLTEGRFKAVMVTSDSLLLHINRYIHLNPLVAGLVTELRDYPWSSYIEYVGKSKENLTEKATILKHFRSTEDYEKFILDQADYAKQLAKIKHATID